MYCRRMQYITQLTLFYFIFSRAYFVIQLSPSPTQGLHYPTRFLTQIVTEAQTTNRGLPFLLSCVPVQLGSFYFR